jgi:hypothetical protein
MTLMCNVIAYILQASAHFLQASAHALQQASSCLLHSATQSLQHFTHKAHKSSENLEFLAHKRAQSAQMSAQSRQALTQSSCPAIVEHIVQHFSHSTMHAKQAAIQLSMFFIHQKLSVKAFSQRGKSGGFNEEKYYTILERRCIIHTFHKIKVRKHPSVFTRF